MEAACPHHHSLVPTLTPVLISSGSRPSSSPMYAAARVAILSPSNSSIGAAEEPEDPDASRRMKKTKRSASPSRLQHLRG